MLCYQSEEVPEYGEADEPKMWPLVAVLIAVAVNLIRVIRKGRHRGLG